jgi:peroxiredoxin Q/BCP
MKTYARADRILLDVAEGLPAPDFTAKANDGSSVTLSGFRGKKNVVLYFYTKNLSPGCRAETFAFRDSYERFASADTELLGISVDPVEAQVNFASHHKIPFKLLSDQDRSISRLYGVLGYGGYFAKRTTFIIDKQGVIRKIFPVVLLPTSYKHPETVLEALRSLGGTGSSF